MILRVQVRDGGGRTRGDVVWRSAAGLHGVGLELLGDAEVGDLEDAILAEEEIFELEVSVRVSDIVKVFNSRHQLAEVVEGQPLARIPLPFDDSVEQFCKKIVVAVLRQLTLTTSSSVQE